MMPFDLLSFIFWLFGPLVAIAAFVYFIAVPILAAVQVGSWILRVGRR